MIDLQAEWVRLCGALNIEATAGAQVWTQLAAAYGEPHRHYHTLDHINAVVANGRRLHDRFTQPDLVLLALFFHDIVYDPARRDNETLSADVLERWLGDHVAADALAWCRRAIEATASHAARGEADIDLLLDIDMAILGAPRDAYLLYAENVAREYLPVYGLETYAAGRAKLFLEPTLAHGRLFLTEPFAAREDQARANLTEELAQWTSGVIAGRLKPGL